MKIAYVAHPIGGDVKGNRNSMSVHPIYSPLPYKQIKRAEEVDYIGQVLFFDPSELYQRVNIDPFKRYQSVNTAKLFPNTIQGICACGCNQLLTGRKTRWATEDCYYVPTVIRNIIAGDTQVIGFFIDIYHGSICSRCNKTPPRYEGLKLDHIVPVKHGGGGCWLNNYQWLCHDCHVQKTNEDFGWKQPKPIPLFES